MRNNNLKQRLPALLCCAFLLTVLSYCSSDQELLEYEPKRILIDAIKVKGSDYLELTYSYEKFINGLTNSQKTMIQEFISFQEANAQNARALEEATCTCQTWESSCSASTWFSSCCVCWNPATHEGGCATFGPMTFCRSEPIEPSIGGREAIVNFVNFYPGRFSEMLIFAHEKGMNTRSIEFEHNKLIALAVED